MVIGAGVRIVRAPFQACDIFSCRSRISGFIKSSSYMFFEKRLKTSKNSILGVRPQAFDAFNPNSMQHVIYHCKDLTETIQNMYILLRLIS